MESYPNYNHHIFDQESESLMSFINITAIAKWCLGLIINKLKTKEELKTSNIT